jgi:hypothetical protein
MSELGVSPDATGEMIETETTTGLNLPSIEDFPRCINCIYSFEDGADCHRHSEIGDNGVVCGDGVFAIGAIGNRQLLTYLGWWETAITMEGKGGAITPETVRAAAHSSGTNIIIDIEGSDSLRGDAWGVP